jgi:branched-chain amino acid transport system ATP-binding protein
MQVLYEINLTVMEGEAVVVFGSNGSGKSTLMKVISGVLKPWSGTIRLINRDITNLRPYERVKMGISFASDMRNLFLSMSVEENLILGAYTKKEKVKEMLERVYHFFPELADARKKLAGELSGGFQRMLSIGRALMSAPKLLMIDELSLGLSPKMAERLGSALLSINRETGIAMLLVEQEIYLAGELCNRGYVLDLGRVVAHGEVKKLLEEDVVRKVYMGGF